MKIFLTMLLTISLAFACTNNENVSDSPGIKPTVSYVTFSQGAEIYATIHGSNFGDFNGTVYFSGQEAVNYLYWNYYKIIVTAPSMVARKGTLWVYVNGIKSNELPYSF